MSFKLSPKIDPEKIFLIKKSELTGRFDPRCYSMKNPFVSTCHPLKKLTEYFYVNPRTHVPPKGEYSFVPMELVSAEDASITEFAEISSDKTKGYTPFQEGDFIFAKITPCMENGKMAIANNVPHFYAYGSTEFHVFRAKNLNVSESYLRAIFLIDDFRRYAKLNFCGSAGQQRVPTDFFKYLQIPIPATNIQDKITALIDSAFTLKKHKEAEAQKYLESIEEYLLSELGLTFPEAKEQIIKDRIFYRNISQISGNSFHPKLYTSSYKAFYERLNATAFGLAELKDISHGVFQGVSRNLTDDPSYVLLKVKNILLDGSIDTDDIEYIKSVPSYKLLQDGDIISPFIGEAIRQIKFSVFDLGYNNYTVDNNTGVIRLKDRYDPQFIAAQLRSIIGSTQIIRLIGGGVPFIGSKNISKIILVCPPLDEQKRIIKHIIQIKKRAMKLQIEANQVLESAKVEVEELI
ncbi:MAG: restriction endonuclease subunit S [Desulfobacterales bacterium]|nr:restriction endonuclease subunit S [Desulfobacterales bacterium]